MSRFGATQTTGRATTSPSRFPLSVSSDGHYLVDAVGRPFLVVGDTAWGLMQELSLSDVRAYLDDRKSRGFNMLRVQATNPSRYVTESVAPASRGAGNVMPFLNSSGGTWDGDPGFRDLNIGGSGTANFDADFSRPVDAYWDWVDTVINEALARGIGLILDYNYMGYNQGASDGWWQTLGQTRHTQTVCQNFGTYIGNRWKNHPNIIISMGTDMFPVSASENSARHAKILDGIQAAGCTQLVTSEFGRSSDARDYSDYASRMTLNGVYPSAGSGSYAPDHGRSRISYNKSPAMPCVVLETKYYNIPSPDNYTRLQMRELGWWGFLSAVGGYMFGNGPVSAFTTTTIGPWQNYVGDDATVDHCRIGSFLNGLAWHKLVPNGLGSIGTLVTAGGGTSQTTGSAGTVDTNNGNDYVAAAATPDGSLLLAYVPNAHTGSVTIDMSKMRGTATCDWYDPSNGSSTVIGSFANSGTHAFTTPGSNAAGDGDWVLRIVA